MLIIRKKKWIRKNLEKVAGINYSAANCKIFLAYFNSESKASLFTDAQFSNW